MVNKENFFYFILLISFLFSEEYERVNTELRLKITTLEKVTASLKSGLVNNFQRKDGV
jgi:hypothetical protein